MNYLKRKKRKPLQNCENAASHDDFARGKVNLMKDSLTFICSVVHDCIRQRKKSL